MVQHHHLNPAEARLRQRPKPLDVVGRLAPQYKAADEGGLGALLFREAARRRAEARRRPKSG